MMEKGTGEDFKNALRQRALLEKSVMQMRSQITVIDMKDKKAHIKQLEIIREENNYIHEEALRVVEKKHVATGALFEKASNSKQESDATIDKLSDDINTVESEVTTTKENLNKYKRCKKTLFSVSPPEWSKAQEAAHLKAQDEQRRECQDSAGRQDTGLDSSPGSVLPSAREHTLSSAHSDTQVTAFQLSSKRSEYKENLELCFSDPQQLLDQCTQLTEQNLSLIHNTARADKTLEELQHTIESAKKKIKEDEEKLTLQVNGTKDRIDQEKERASQLKKRVHLYESLKTEDHDVLLDALGVKVTEVYRCNVDRRLTSLSTWEKLCRVEYRLSELLELTENIPEESLVALWQIKDSERRSRLREEELRLEREKQRERLKKCMQRSLSDAKKITGRRLMPRSILVEQKTKVSNEDDVTAKDDLYTNLFTTEDAE